MAVPVIAAARGLAVTGALVAGRVAVVATGSAISSVSHTIVSDIGVVGPLVLGAIVAYWNRPGARAQPTHRRKRKPPIKNHMPTKPIEMLSDPEELTQLEMELRRRRLEIENKLQREAEENKK